MSRTSYLYRIVIYCAVISLAPVLPYPWMIAAQAALGGIMVGIRFEQMLNEPWPHD